jgi:hypothetical protein
VEEGKPLGMEMGALGNAGPDSSSWPEFSTVLMFYDAGAAWLMGGACFFVSTGYTVVET